MDKVEKLIHKGQKLLSQGNYQGAAKVFANALKRDGSVSIRNNLALSLYLSDQPEEALKILEPAFQAERPDQQANPFTYALASRISAALGRADAAKNWLDAAVQLFDRMVKLYEEYFGVVPDSFREYTTMIMGAAADLMEHRTVLELYRRWRDYHLTWETKFLAGIAAFNLGKYKQAVRLWAGTEEVYQASALMQQVAFLVERGIIPPFEMGYKQPWEKELTEGLDSAADDEEKIRQSVQDGFLRMGLLTFLLVQKDTEAAARIAYSLVTYGEEWGERLGWNMLESAYFSAEVKMAAAEALTDRGLIAKGEPVTMNIDGKTRQVVIKKEPVVMERDEELDALVDEAIRLRDGGDADAAIKLLRDTYLQGKFYPRAVMTLANLLRQKGELEESFQLMKLLEELLPDDPIVLFNFAALMLQMNELEKARLYLERIDREGLPAEFLAKLELLEDQLALVEMPRRMMALYEEDARKRVEEKPLPLAPTLSRGLKNMPANWLEGACLRYGLAPARLRREKEKQLIEYLSRKENLEQAVSELSEEDIELLQVLLRKDGWSRIGAITRKFGSLEGDGFHWEAREPESPLGYLWSGCIVMVGKAVIEGRRAKIVTIPVELREPLKEILGELF